MRQQHNLQLTYNTEADNTRPSVRSHCLSQDLVSAENITHTYEAAVSVFH